MCWYCYDAMDAHVDWTNGYLDKHLIPVTFMELEISNESRFLLNGNVYEIVKRKNQPGHHVIDSSGNVRFTSVHVEDGIVTLGVKLPETIECSATLRYEMIDRQLVRLIRRDVRSL